LVTLLPKSKIRCCHFKPLLSCRSLPLTAMVSSIGFFSHFPRFPNFSFSRASSSAPFLATAALAAASALGLSLAASSLTDSARQGDISHIGWASLSLGNAIFSPVEPKTGEVFPEEVDGRRRLLGVGVRRTNVLGLKSIDVYAFGTCLFSFLCFWFWLSTFLWLSYEL
jgi:hypothetical protein